MRIEKFEDLKAWREARKLADIIYEATNKYVFKRDLDLARQLRRSSVSIMANIGVPRLRFSLSSHLKVSAAIH